MKKILACVPTFNESGNIKILCKKILWIKKIDLLILSGSIHYLDNPKNVFQYARNGRTMHEKVENLDGVFKQK